MNSDSESSYKDRFLLFDPTFRYLYREEYPMKILISGFAEETVLEDVRFRFSVYGDIKDCYWLPNSKEGREACIIFYDTNSAIEAMSDKYYIRFHQEKLKIRRMFVDKKTLQEHLENYPGNTSINELNDDCLLEVFKYVPILERIKLRRVSTRWCTIANKSLRSLQHIDLEITDKNVATFYNAYWGNELPELFGNIEKLGLDVDKCKLYYKNQCFSSLYMIAFLNKLIIALVCTNLAKLIIGCSTYDEYILTRILKMNPNLRHIEIRNNQYITGESLIHLPENVHTFILECHGKLQYNLLCAALKRLKNLKCLILFYIDVCDILNILKENCKNLETLQFNWTVRNERMEFNQLLPITNLKNLKDLRIVTCKGTTETFLVNLGKNCKELRRLEILRSLTRIESRIRISKRAMNAVTSLAKLRILHLMFCDGINFGNLCELRKIYIEDSDIQDEQVITVIRNSPELRRLCLSNCKNITRNLFAKVRMISARRCNDVMLDMTIAPHDDEIYYIVRRVIFNGKIY